MTKSIKAALIFAGMQLVVAILATVAKKLGYIDQDTTVRILMVSFGLLLLFNANAASKVVSRSARSIANHRLLGWSMALGALAWTGLWLFAPMDFAGFAAMAAVALGTFAPVAYCLLTRPKTPA